MKNKPLVFTILSILCLIEPVIKILYFKAATGFDFSQIFSNLLQRSEVREIFDFWLVFPFAGILLIKIRRFTYFAFMSILIYIFYGILTYEAYTWPYYSESPLMYHYAVVFGALAVFVYFLMPQVREPFFNQRIRWWETKARYPVVIPCGLKNDQGAIQSDILNISLTGVFIKEHSQLKVGDKFNVNFAFEGKDFSIPVEIIHHQNRAGETSGFGAKFQYVSFRQNVQISKIIGSLKQSKKLR